MAGIKLSSSLLNKSYLWNPLSYSLLFVCLFKLLTQIVSYRNHHFLKGPGGSLPEFMQQYFLEVFSHRFLPLHLLCCRIWNTSDQDGCNQQNTDNISLCSWKQQTALHALTHQSNYMTTVLLTMQPKDLYFQQHCKLIVFSPACFLKL